MVDRVGQQLGNYRLLRLLERGGFADVYLGEHIHLKSRAALKVLHTHLTDKEAEHFQQEAQTIATLAHPSIVRVLDYDVQDGVPFLVMDYAPDGSLRRRHPPGEVVPLPLLLSYVKQVADALQYAHEHKLVHRDVKPENMLVGRRQELLLSDFGIATVAHSTASLSAEAAVGTIAYMAPEQIQDQPRPASDQYALGVTVYEWLCGVRPFSGSFTALVTQHLWQSPPPLQGRAPEITAEIEQVVLRALAKDPKQRFPSVVAFAEALEQASGHASSRAELRAPGASLPSAYGTVAAPPSQATEAIPPTGQEGEAAELESAVSGSPLPAAPLAPLIQDEQTPGETPAPTPLRDELPDLSPAIEEAVQRALTKEPEQRLAGVKDFSMSLREAAQAPSPSLTSRAPIAERKGLRSVVKPAPLWRVPTTFTSLVGRKRDVAAIEAMLMRPEVRLLTLLGTGGIGKTRLALQVAMRMRAFFSDGVCFADLASTSDPTLIQLIIGETLGIRQGVNLSIFKQVELFLRDKQMLLILDNFEQVVTAAPLIENLLTACPLLKIVVTSRAVLHLQAEHEYQVAPLSLPDLKRSPTSEDLAHSAAVALFVQRAQAVLSTFRFTRANARTIAEICVQLDGIPLAIELAAARIRLLPPQALLSRLSQRFEMLTGGAVTLPTRQQTLRNTLKWSYDLLDANEQKLFRRLAVFAGGWTLEAVEALGNADQETQDALAVLNAMASLIDKSLVQQVEKEGTEPRFEMLMTVREYGLDCLRERGEDEQIQRAHADYYLALAEEAEPHLKVAQQLPWLRRLDREQENLRAALGWLIAHEEVEKTLRFCEALWWFWQTRGYWSEGRRWLKAVLALPGTAERTAMRAKALSAAGELATVQGDEREARLLLSESVALFRELADDRGLVLPLATLGEVMIRQGDPTAGVLLMEESIALCRKLGCNWELSLVLLRLGYIAWLQGDLEQALALAQESLTLARELGDKILISRALNGLGYATWLQGDPLRATALAEEGLILRRELGDKAFITSALDTLGSIALSQDDLERATACFTEGLSVAQELGNQTFIAWHLMGLARVAVVHAQLKRAARLFGAAEVSYDVNKELSPNQRDDYERMISSVRTKLGELAFAAAWAEGRTMTMEQILAALEPPGTPEPALPASPSQAIVKPSPAPTYPDDLTAREVEVLRLLAQGWTDAQIAEHLVISPRTVNTHLTSIYRKIQVSSRGAASRYAVNRKLL
jgi:predicted ATPase/DNA-binding CsgD family transcriptional regulator/tRNA A-37 threonylcarbamoyl transferase component Bud32